MPNARDAAREQIVGREAELDAVDDFLASGGTTPTALVLAGTAGIGKTTTVRAATERAQAQGLRVLLARPSRGEAELPYVGLADLLASTRSATLGWLAPPQRRALGAATAREGSSATVDPHALSRGLLELLRREAADGGVLVVVDDAQWLDRPTEQALTFALRRIAPVPLRILAATRTDAADELPFGLADWTSTMIISLGPMGPTELGSLLRGKLGVALSRPRLEALHRASGGNPMFALELVRSGADPTSAAGSTTTLLRTLAQRIVGLDGAIRDVVAAASASLRPTPELLVRAGCSREGFEGAIGAGILQLDAGRLTFTHPLLASTAYEILLPEDRLRMHRRLADATDDVVERGHHVGAAAMAPDLTAANALDLAADAAAALGDHAGAARFSLRAARLASGSVGRELRAANELQLAGDVVAGAELAAGLVRRLPPGPTRATARRILADCSVGSPHSYNEALAELETALGEADGDDLVQAEIHVDLAVNMLGVCDLEGALKHAHRAGELARRARVQPLQVEALAVIGFAESMLGQGVTAAARRAVELWDGESVFELPPRTTLACVCIPDLRFGEAERLLEDEFAFAVDRGLEEIEVIARAHLAEVQLRAGRWREALTNARSAYAHALQASSAQTVVGVAYGLAMTLAALGDHGQALALATDSLRAAEATDDFWFRISHRAVLGQIALTESHPDEVLGHLEPAWALMRERGLGDLSLFPVAQTLAEALVAVGRADDADKVARALRTCPAGGNAWCRAMAARIDALAAAARGEHAAARTAFALALDAHADLPEPFEHARTLLLLGRAERSARSWGAARSAFSEALSRFDALGAARWSEQAASDLARLPGRRPADGHLLSPREQEIAELVSGGLANKEIADRLHLSVSTVEANLSRAYSKLGVRSRTELAAWIASRASA